jgi:hypothetical protein
MMEEWQRRMRAEKDAARKKKTEAASVLQNYRGGVKEEELKLTTIRKEERKKQEEAAKNLHSYRSIEPVEIKPKPTRLQPAMAPSGTDSPVRPAPREPLKMAPGAVSALAATFDKPASVNNDSVQQLDYEDASESRFSESAYGQPQQDAGNDSQTDRGVDDFDHSHAQDIEEVPMEVPAKTDIDVVDESPIDSSIAERLLPEDTVENPTSEIPEGESNNVGTEADEKEDDTKDAHRATIEETVISTECGPHFSLFTVPPPMTVEEVLAKYTDGPTESPLKSPSTFPTDKEDEVRNKGDVVQEECNEDNEEGQTSSPSRHVANVPDTNDDPIDMLRNDSNEYATIGKVQLSDQEEKKYDLFDSSAGDLEADADADVDQSATKSVPTKVEFDVLFSFGLVTSSEKPNFDCYMIAVNKVMQSILASDKDLRKRVRYNTFRGPRVREYSFDSKLSLLVCHAIADNNVGDVCGVWVWVCVVAC